MIPDIDRVVDPSFLAGLVDRSSDELRAMRAECSDLENGVSFVRRLAQGRLDLVTAESDRRASGKGGSASELVDNLADVLADGMGAPGSGRVAQELEPPENVVSPLTARLDEVAGVAVISEIPSLDNTEVSAAVVALRNFEESLSNVRRQLHSTIDALNDQLAKRYSAGEATVNDG